MDLFFFLLSALAVSTAQVLMPVAILMIGLGAILKYYPLLGLSIFMFKPGRVLLTTLVSSVLIFGAYLAVTAQDLQVAWGSTQRGGDVAYGTQVLAMHFLSKPASPGVVALSGPPISLAVATGILYGLALLIVYAATWLAVRSPYQLVSSSQRNLAAFWMGASIYVGTFFLGNNWSYRLAFLLFVIPQLGEWTRTLRRGGRLLTCTTMGLVLLTCWYLFFRNQISADWRESYFLFDQFLQWALFGNLIYLFLASVPENIRAALSLRSTQLSPSKA